MVLTINYFELIVINRIDFYDTLQVVRFAPTFKKLTMSLIFPVTLDQADNTTAATLNAVISKIEKPRKSVRYFITIILFTGLMVNIVTSTQAASTYKANSHKSCANFNNQGELIRPTSYREWIYVGTPLTPNELNNGKPSFPEFHNVYIDPESWEAWKKAGHFHDNTIIIKELVSIGSKKIFSSNDYFMGEYPEFEAMVESKKHFPNASGNWGFFRFTNEDHKDPKTVVSELPESACLACHTPNAQHDQVFI